MPHNIDDLMASLETVGIVYMMQIGNRWVSGTFNPNQLVLPTINPNNAGVPAYIVEVYHGIGQEALISEPSIRRIRMVSALIRVLMDKQY